MGSYGTWMVLVLLMVQKSGFYKDDDYLPLFFLGFSPSQVVVWDFIYQRGETHDSILSQGFYLYLRW